MPISDAEPALRRARTEADDSLDQAMRPTDHISAVDIDDDDDSGAIAAPKRATTDVRTGKNVIEETTDIGEPPLPPSMSMTAAVTSQLAAQGERTGQTSLPGAVDPAPSNSSRTPIPTMDRQDRQPQTPIPQLELHNLPPPISTAPQTLPPPKKLVASDMPTGPTPACPQCESPMAWVEEHLRFYCRECRMYF